MNQLPIIRYLFFMLSMLIIHYGCIPQIQRELPPSPAVKTAHPISLQALEKRSVSLKQLLDSGELDQVQREAASTLLTAYERVHNVLVNTQDPDSTREIAAILFDCLGQIETKAVQKSQYNETQGTPFLKQYGERRKKIFDYYFYGNDQGVIDEVVDMENIYGASSLTPEIGLVFAFSLARKGMLEEALDVAEHLLTELEGRPDLIHLRAKMVEWHLGLGNRVSALRSYERLLDGMDERKGIFEEAQRAVLQNVTKGPAERPEEQVPTAGDAGPGELAGDSLDQMIDEVNRLCDRHDYHNAKLLIIRRKLRALDDSETAILDSAFQRVEQAEIDSRNQGISPAGTPAEKSSFETVRVLIEKEKFEQALVYLSTLEGKGSVAPEIKELRAYATERIINRDRDKAARLFLMARNTNEAEKKREHLISSYKILKNLIDKYPLSPLYEKINDNIKTVENELTKLGIVHP